MATIGADPELIIKVNGKVVVAKEYIEHIAGVSFTRGGVGRDASGRPLELRPKPSTKPTEIVDNLSSLLRDALHTLPGGSELYVGSFFDGIGGIGGHFHAWGRGGTRERLHSDLFKNKICVGLTYLWRLEHPLSAYHRRCQTGYGFAHDVRRSEPGWEFRTPSADWLASPTLAKHSLSFFQTLVDNVTKYLNDALLVENLIAEANNIWSNNSGGQRQRMLEVYSQKVLNVIKYIIRPEDITRIDFFAERLHNWRDEEGLIRLDPHKWRTS